MLRRKSRVAQLALLAALAFGIGAGVARPVSAQERTAAFEPTACKTFEVPENFDKSGAVECGYVRVPEQHDSPNGPQIQLAVVILKSTAREPEPDPLFMLQGGPGGSTIHTYLQYFAIGQLSGLLAQRDLVLFDQRGTLYSRPALTCPEIMDLTIATIEQRLDRADANRRYVAALGECRARLAADGINLGAFDSLENADDIEAVRAALGYEQINLYGVSYGSLLALHAMRESPEQLRSVIIDAIVPTQVNFMAEVPHSQQRAFDELFAACAADSGCDAAYPDLKQVFFDLVSRLNREPIRLPLTDSKTQISYSAVVDGDTLEGWLFQLLYATEVIPALPLVIYQLRDGETAFLSTIMSNVVFDRTFAHGFYNTVICAEDADFQAEDVSLDGVQPELAEYAREDAQAFLDGCRLWDVPALDPIVDEPVRSSIPTLILNGRFDPITPPANGALVAETIEPSTVVTFGYTGHGALTTGDCAASIVTQFLASPMSTPDTSCAGSPTAPAFYTSETVRLAPRLGRLVAEISGASFGALLLPILSLLLLGTIVMAWPLALVVRLMAKWPWPRTGLAAIANWLAVAALLLGTAVIVGLTVVIFQSLVGGEMLGFFGLPLWASPLLWLPWVVGAVALAMVGLAGVAWRSGWWTLAGRIYYALLALAAVALAAWLILLGVG